MTTYDEINKLACVAEAGMRRNAGDQINTAFVHGFMKGEQQGYLKGLEDGRRQGVAIDGDKRYWDGYHAAQEDGQKIYQKGYEEGARCQDEVQYQKGLEDAWTAARKIMLDFTYDELHDIFGCYTPAKILETFSSSEAIEKIREYEEKQKNKTEIKVGTKVRTTKDKDHSGVDVFPIGTVGTVVEIELSSKYPYKVYANGTYWWYSKDMFEVIKEDENQGEARSGYEEDGESTEQKPKIGHCRDCK